jgi:hypothetical protein
MITALAVLTIVVGLCAGFVAPPSPRWVLALAGGAVFFFVAALVMQGWDLAWNAAGLVVAVPIVAARTAATKWSTPDPYDED